MHCDTSEKAKIFCDFLDKSGRTWSNGIPYKERVNFCINGTTYYFNDGTYSSKEYAEENGYTVLEFDDFNWE